MGNIYLAKSELSGAIYAVNGKSKTNVTDFVTQLIQIETQALATRISELEAMVNQATHIQFPNDSYLEHKENGLGWRGYIGSVFSGGVSVTDIEQDVLSTFKSLQASKEQNHER